MATSTSNLGLIKPAGTDHALVANINTNSDTIDTEAGKARANFALVQNGDTATQAISKDQLVVWKGVLKKASANIASGATLSSSNLTDDTIAAELAALNSNLASLNNYFSITGTTGVGNLNGVILIPKSTYPDYKAIIPLGLDVDITYRVGSYYVDNTRYYFMVTDLAGNKQANKEVTFCVVGVK